MFGPPANIYVPMEWKTGGFWTKPSKLVVSNGTHSLMTRETGCSQTSYIHLNAEFRLRWSSGGLNQSLCERSYGKQGLELSRTLYHHVSLSLSPPLSLSLSLYIYIITSSIGRRLYSIIWHDLAPVQPQTSHRSKTNFTKSQVGPDSPFMTRITLSLKSTGEHKLEWKEKAEN